MNVKVAFRTVVVLLGVTGLLSFNLACSEEDEGGVAGAGIPAVKPPVESATPAGLVPVSSSSLDAFGGFVTGQKVGTFDTGGQCSGTEVDGFCISNFKSRIYPDNGDGPTAVLELIDGIDTRFAEINTRSQQGNGKKCLDQEPTALSVTTVSFTETFYLQCYDELDSSSYLAFGKKDGVWYLLEYSGASAKAVKISPIDGSDGEYTVSAYLSVGKSNASSTDCDSIWDGCSYAAMALKANSQDKSFEFTAAGVGIGFCGIHMNSDGTYTYVNSSEEAAAGACETSADTACLSNSDLSDASGNCTSLSSGLTLTSLGRKSASGSNGANGSNAPATWAAAEIPSAGGNVDIDGSDDDGIHFLLTNAEIQALGIMNFSVDK